MAYGTVADWIAYAALRGVTVVDNTDAAQALQRGSDYIRTRYVTRLGYAEDDERVIEAAYIAAGYELTTPGFWSATYTGSQTKVLTKVGDISWTPVEGGSRGADSMLPTSPAIDALLMTSSTYGQPAVMVV